MRKMLVAVAVLMLSGCIGSAQDKSRVRAPFSSGASPVHVIIQATPEQIKRAALDMFARNGYSLDSDTTLQLKVAKPFSDEETAAYNTAHWTNVPVANCRHVQAFLLSSADEGTRVALTTEMVCRTDGWQLYRLDGDKKEIQWAQNTLADLKTKIEETNKRR